MLFLFLIVLVAVEGFVRIYEYTSIVCPNIESEAFADVDPLTRKQICNDHNREDHQARMGSGKFHH